MAVTQNAYTGDGQTVLFSFTFPYLSESDIKVYVGGVLTTQYTLANATTVQLNAAPSNGQEVLIKRATDVDTIGATFYPGSAIRAQDMNDNFNQLLYAAQEDGQFIPQYNAEFPDDLSMGGNQINNLADPTAAQDAATKAYVDSETWSNTGETVDSNEVWTSNDSSIATTGAIDNQVASLIDQALTNDIAGSDGITVTDDGDGTVTVGIASNSVDLDRIKDEDILTYAEQNAGSPSWNSDSRIPTTYAAAKRFDTLVQVATPTGTDWEVGKTWLQNDADKTLSIWNGSAWVAVASGGSFTELTKVIYVDSVNGDDALAGHRISNPKRTIKAAVDDINADANGDGSIVLVAPGIYGEEFPIDIQKNDVAIVGQSLRNCIIHPAIPAADQAGYDVNVPEANELQTMFRVNSGSYFYGLTLQGMKASGTRGGNALDTDATYGLPTNQGWNFAFYPGATIKKSPYIQNCTNFSDSQINNVTFAPHTPGEGAAGDLDSAPSGGGILIDGNTPSSSSPLRSMVCDSYTHTALNGPGIFVTNNGYCQATSSYSFFNHYHLKTKNGGQANLAASTTDFGSYSLIADGRSTAAIFTATTTASANDGDITFTIGAPVVGSPWHGSATRPQDNMLVDVNGITYPVLSATANGAGWDVTISRPDPNDRSSNLGLTGAVSSGAAASFFLRSMVASSGHTMEYVGSGTDYRALPENGGVPDNTKQITELNNGKVWAAITDHRGTFKIGDTFEVNQQTGFVSIDSTASDAVTKTAPTGSAIIPSGTNAQRDASPSNGYFRYNTTNNAFEGYVGGAWTAVGGGITDGDKGDITVSAAGATWTIDSGVVSTTKMGGDVTAAGKALLDDADAAAQRTTLGLGTAATSASTDFFAASDVSAFGATLIDDADAATARTTLGLGTAAVAAGPVGTIVGTTDAQTLTNKTLGDITETVYTITDGASVDLDPANGPIQLWTLGASRTATATNFAAGESLTIGVTAGANTLTWPTITWVGGSAPTLATSGATYVVLWKVSSTLYGANVGDVA